MEKIFAGALQVRNSFSRGGVAQVAAQQGAFVAHLLNDDAPPAEYGVKVREALEEGVRDGDEVARAVAQSEARLARPFEFLSLGILAYVGNRKAIAQVPSPV